MFPKPRLHNLRCELANNYPLCLNFKDFLQHFVHLRIQLEVNESMQLFELRSLSHLPTSPDRCATIKLLQTKYNLSKLLDRRALQISAGMGLTLGVA